MKFNLEVTKEEAKKILGMKTPLQKIGEVFSRGFNKLNRDLNKKKEHQLNKIAFYCVTFILIIAGLMWGFYATYQAGINDGVFKMEEQYTKTIHQNNYEYLSEKPFSEVASSVGKRILIIIGDNLSILFLIVGISWVIHGVGFRII